MYFWIGALLLLLLASWRVYHLQMLYYLLRAIYWERPVRRVDEESTLQMRVMPAQVDWNAHMGNSEYNLVCDFGRYHHLARVFGRSVAGANGGVYMRFKRSLKPFEAYELRTRIAGWDRKWLWVEHRFFSMGRCKAAALCKVVIHGQTPQQALKSRGIVVEEVRPCAGDTILQSERGFGRDAC